MVRLRLVSLLYILLIFVGCGGGDNEPKLSGDPQLDVKANEMYEFQPVAEGFEGGVEFNIQNKPAWADFDESSGRLFGVPNVSDLGVFDNIVISVSGLPEGGEESKSVSLEAFSITVLPAEADNTLTISSPATQGKAPFSVIFTPTTSIKGAFNSFNWSVKGENGFEKNANTASPLEIMFDKPGSYQVSLMGEHGSGVQYVSNEIAVEISGSEADISSYFKFYASSYATTELSLVRFYLEYPPGVQIENLAWDLDGNPENVLVEALWSALEGGFPAFQYTPGVYQPQVTITYGGGKSLMLETPPITVVGLFDPRINILSDGDLLSGQYLVSSPGEYEFSFQTYLISKSNIVSTKWYLGDTDEIIGNSESVVIPIQANELTPLILEVEDLDGNVLRSSVEVAVSDISFDVVVKEDSSFFVDHVSSKTAEFSITPFQSVEFSVVVENQSRELVKTLREMAPGDNITYGFEWNGMDDFGEPVSDGGYNLVTYYSNAGDIIEYKKKRFAYYEGGFPTNSITVFSDQEEYEPFNNDPLRAMFSLGQVSQITIAFGFQQVPAPVKGVLTSEYLPPGDHEFYWHTTDDQGVFLEIDAETAPQPGIWIYTPPNDFILVKSSPLLGKVETSPYVFNPRSKYGVSESVSISKFTVDRPADIHVAINDADSGKLVYESTIEDHASGLVQFKWNGTDNSGNFVAAGRYHFTFSAENEHGPSVSQNSLQQIWY